MFLIWIFLWTARKTAGDLDINIKIEKNNMGSIPSQDTFHLRIKHMCLGMEGVKSPESL